ncbi:pirin family protein [Rhodococcus coprophilus]|uniref:pirin family protein n=1 Tax=Rhodococcus coprophilus TaxID=38310 RepID=UPI003421B4AB
MSTTPHDTVLDVRRADARDKTRIGWLDSKHSFSFGHHYDPANTHHGVLMVNNDDIVAPGTGFDTHPHQDMEIATWVLEGSLVHQDSTGNSGVLYPGLAQRMSAGTGILHSEKNDSWRFDGAAGIHADRHDNPVHFIQMWVLPDESGITPGYEQLEIDHELLAGGLVPVASGMKAYADHSAIRIRNKYAAMHVARVQPGQPVSLPDAPYLHVFVARGEAALEGAGPLAEGDAVRISGGGGQMLTTATGAEVIVWEMHATLGQAGR